MSSNYETEHEFGRGKRKKIMRQLSCDESFSTNITKSKRLKYIPTSDDSDVDGDDSANNEFRCKRNAPSPPLISFRSQNNKTEKNLKGNKTRIEMLQNNSKIDKKNNTILTSHQSTKSKKDLLLTKIHEAKKETSAKNKKETLVIIQTARQKQTCSIEDNVSEPKLVSTLHMQL